MTGHPNQLHALAALWSLRAAWPRLLSAAASAAAADALNGDLGTLQAWRPGSGVHSAGDGNLLLDAVIRHTGPPVNHIYDERITRTRQTLFWAAEAILGPAFRPLSDTIGQLIGAVRTTTPQDAGYLHLWIDEQDQLVRRVLREGDDHQLVPTVGCPHCDGGALAVRTSAPTAHQVIVCHSGCVCAGEGCGCRMGIEAQGVAHIWTRRQIVKALR